MALIPVPIPVRPLRHLPFVVALLALCWVLSGRAQAEGADFWAATGLIDAASSSAQSARVVQARRPGYELSDGTPAPFSRWYGRATGDPSLSFLTALTPDVGLLWGLSAGDRGGKYRIGPGGHLGLLVRHDLGPGLEASLSAQVRLGGWLTEQPCLADYGAIGGGPVAVNCRLAATELAPEDTLEFLLRAPPPDRFLLNFVLRWSF